MITLPNSREICKWSVTMSSQCKQADTSGEAGRHTGERKTNTLARYASPLPGIDRDETNTSADLQLQLPAPMWTDEIWFSCNHQWEESDSIPVAEGWGRTILLHRQWPRRRHLQLPILMWRDCDSVQHELALHVMFVSSTALSTIFCITLLIYIVHSSMLTPLQYGLMVTYAIPITYSPIVSMCNTHSSM